MGGFQRGRRLALDVGRARIGVAVSDPDGILATPVETVRAAKDGSDIRRILALVDDFEPIEVVVGLPRTLRGEHGASAQMAESFARGLRAALARSQREPAPRVCFSDERFTTVAAQRALRENGMRAKQQRSVIDQAAAVAILQGWLDEQRSAATGSEEDDE
ncbi:Holliday junction resolvase RuvX [Tsukamurella sp. 8F]|uniref:Holliday junction resolvase RuvX n=1 Tax=unclassified Tsukamurella TaxID=2633480 RepID=UPI0023B9D39F|nr:MULTISPECIES: Holliday junction resolvase RuvX [unclassified Tsukamurella]MDF0529175.1 Holliday junction resolvase RuvX [Tsukamurella sp. 8J]MDF0585360.1 Holliday junction resolvase RuvX [Tsukamurella sp. 8F]